MSKVLEPLGQRVVVRRRFDKERGGIIIPEDRKRLSIEGTVVYAGPEAEVNPGDKVVWGKFAGFELPNELEHEEYILMNDEDILARIKEDGDG